MSQRERIKSFGGIGFEARIYNEWLDKERFFMEWNQVNNGIARTSPKTLGPYATFQIALDAVISISAALKPLVLQVDIKK